MDNIDNMNDYGTTQQENAASHDKSSGVRTYRPNRPGMGGSHKPYKEASPEEIQQMVSEKVAKAVAAAAGAVEGFATQMKESRLAENTKQAITSVGETASTIVGTTRKQIQTTRDAFQGEFQDEEGGGLSGSSGGESYGGPSHKDDTASSSGAAMGSGSFGGPAKGGNKGAGSLGKGGNKGTESTMGSGKKGSGAGGGVGF